MSDLDTSDWPHWLRRFADIIGPERTLELAARYGSLDTIQLPRHPGPQFLWRGLLTAEECQAICDRYAGERVAFPRRVILGDGKKEAVIDAIEAGLPTREIAIRCRVSQRYVRSVRTMMGLSGRTRRKSDPRQLELDLNVD